MDNKIKHHSLTQLTPSMEFKPILRGEAPYYGNLNRPAQSAYDLSLAVADLVSWGGCVSILQPLNQGNSFKLYDIVQINNSELVVPATDNDDLHARYGIVVAEAEFDTVTSLNKNIVVCTFCPNFVYPAGSAPGDAAGTPLYFNSTDLTFLAASGSGTYTSTRKLAIKTGPNSMFFSGTATLW